jgi:hypothetical protein
MKKTLILSIALLAGGMAYAQKTESFEQYVKKEQKTFAEYSRQTQDEFRKYNDSLNRDYAAYLEQEWKSFNLQKKKPPIKNPISTPPVYDPNVPQPEPEKCL